VVEVVVPEVKPVETVPEGPLILKEEQAIYLYHPPKTSNFLQYFTLLEMPNGINSIAEKVEELLKKKRAAQVRPQTPRNPAIPGEEARAEPIPFGPEIEAVPSSSRWVVPAHSEMSLVVAFRTNTMGNYDAFLHFETVESKAWML
jgi:hypothetical protein